MCYNVQYLKRRAQKYAKLAGIKFDESQFEDKHYVNGFSHPILPVLLDSAPDQITPVSWGLIPGWTKTEEEAKKISNQTLNAMGETIFLKPAFRTSAMKKRCLILLTGFYEYHHHPSGNKIPYFITEKDQDVMFFAGLWESWKGQTTCSIVTTSANPTMAHIHNNPDVIKRTGGGRMPLILPSELAFKWLDHPTEINERAEIEKMILPYPDELLNAYTVRPLQGKNGVGNAPEASEPFTWVA